MTKRSATKKPELTQWFDGSKFVPYHVGEYLTRFQGDAVNRFRWWDGNAWSIGYCWWVSEKSKDIKRKIIALRSNYNWRGLAQNPEVQP